MAVYPMAYPRAGPARKTTDIAGYLLKLAGRGRVSIYLSRVSQLAVPHPTAFSWVRVREDTSVCLRGQGVEEVKLVLRLNWRKFGEEKRSHAMTAHKLLITLALPRGLEPLFSP
jgi:hypothetical protein